MLSRKKYLLNAPLELDDALRIIDLKAYILQIKAKGWTAATPSQIKYSEGECEMSSKESREERREDRHERREEKMVEREVVARQEAAGEYGLTGKGIGAQDEKMAVAEALGEGQTQDIEALSGKGITDQE